MATLFLAVYPLVSLFYIIGYVPQIVKLVKADRPPKSVSIFSWFIWLAGNILTLGYVHYHLSDAMMMFTTALCLFFCFVVVVLTYYNMNHRFMERNCN